MNFLPATIGEGGRHVELPVGDRIPIAENGFEAEGGRAVTLGIRPEDLVRVEDGDGIAQLTVDLVEHLGADTLVHGHFGNDRTVLTTRLQGVWRLGQGEALRLAVRPERLHLFDAESGRRLHGA